MFRTPRSIAPRPLVALLAIAGCVAVIGVAAASATPVPHTNCKVTARLDPMRGSVSCTGKHHVSVKVCPQVQTGGKWSDIKGACRTASGNTPGTVTAKQSIKEKCNKAYRAQVTAYVGSHRKTVYSGGEAQTCIGGGY